jgi:hypothetical protein
MTVLGLQKNIEPARGLLSCGAVCGALLLPYVALAAFAHPIADDFTYAFDTQRDGFWAAYRAQYVSWNGRFASNVFELAGPMVWGSVASYRAVAVAMLMGTALAAYCLVRALTRGAWSRPQGLGAAVALSAVFVTIVPSLGETIYWYTSTVTYQLSAILFAIHAAMTIDALAGDVGVSSRARLAAAFVLVPVVVGMNEVAMAMIVLFLASVLAIAAIEGRRRVTMVAGAMLAVALASSLAVWLAPGNAVRAAMYPVRHDLFRSLALTVLQTIRFGAAWTTSGPLVLASLLYLPLAAEVAERVPVFRAVSPLGATAMAAGAVLTIPIATFPVYWSTGLLGQHRTPSIACFVFVLLWFATLTALVATGRLPTATRFTGDPRVRAAVFVLFATSLACTGNASIVVVDVAHGRPPAFAREMAARNAALRACARTPQAPCFVARLSARPDSFYVVDVVEDPDSWINNAYRYYFHTGAVSAKATTP